MSFREMPIRSVKDMGRIVRERRKEAGISQEDLAMYSNTSRRIITDLENGKRDTFEIGKLLAICNALGIRPGATL